MNANDLLHQLSQRFDNCAVDVEHNIVRCEHRVGNAVRSVYFFCLLNTLPSSIELSQLQEQVVAPSYYLATDASRWNHFLVFVTASPAVSDRDRFERARIEADKSYARKIVVPDSELGAFLGRTEARVGPAVHANALQQIWTGELENAGLSAIAADDARAPIIRAIRAGRLTAIEPPPAAPETITPVDTPLTLRRLELRRFGDRSLRGDFQLRRVNLIRGPNGAGKTSFFEAIEHFFCGATSRNKSTLEDLDATVTFSNNHSSRYKVRATSYYQAKDLAWYGRSTNRGNRLCEGFARYHFMSTDAAVELGRDPVLRDIKEALAKIALGPDASYTWNRILEFERDIGRELAPLPTQWNTIEDRRQQDERRLQALRTPSLQVVAQVSALEPSLIQLGWPREQFPGSSMELKDFATFQPLQALLDKAVSEPPRTVEAITQAIASFADDGLRAKGLERVQHTVSVESAALRSERQTLDERLAHLVRLRQYVERSYGELLYRQQEGNRTIAALSRFQMAENDIGWLKDTLRRQQRLEQPLVQVANVVQASVNELHRSLQEQQQLKAREQASAVARESLVGQLRGLARHYAEQHPQADACPVCNTTMTATELLQKLEILSRDHMENALEELTATVAMIEHQVADEQECYRLLSQLMGMDAAGPQETCAQALAAAWQRQEALKMARANQATVEKELELMLVEGFSQEDYGTLLVTYVPDQVGTETAKASLATRLDDELNGETDRLRTIAVRLGELDKEWEQCSQEIAALGRRYGGAGDAVAIGDAVQQGVVSYTAFLEALKALPASVMAAYADDIPALLALSKTVTADFETIGERIRLERSRDAEIKALEVSIAENRSAGDQLRSEMDNLHRAQDTLVSLKTNHSLDQGLASFLGENQVAIQNVFSRIHVPNELKLSGLAECRLERAHTQSVADLSQISTGQRAALTLSIFLTLNLSLQAGPPIMLIDDPVAHIDDLNALAFLDYLADIAEEGTRQIFFATADDRLANLFEKKMGFLDTELAVINLTPDVGGLVEERLN